MNTVLQAIKDPSWISGINNLPIIGAIGALTLGAALSKQLPSRSAAIYTIGMGAIVGMEGARWANRSYELLPSLEQYLPNAATNTYLLMISTALLGVILATRSLCSRKTERKVVDVPPNPQVIASPPQQPQVKIKESDWAVGFWGEGVVIPSNKSPTTADGITNAWATLAARQCDFALKSLEKSFPATTVRFDSQIDLFNRQFPVIPHAEMPTVYAPEKLEKECKLLLAHAFEVAEEVYKDLSKWSQEKKFGNIGGALLSSHGHWLNKGFVMFSEAYRTIYNLEDHFELVERRKESLEEACEEKRQEIADGKAFFNTLPPLQQRLKTLQKYEEYFSLPNKKALGNWRDLFFTPGTKQYEWRENYNKAMAKILELAPEGVDPALLLYGRGHGYKEYPYIQRT